MSDYPNEEMKAMEEDYRRVTNKCDDLEEQIEKYEAALADLTIDNCKANELLCRCQGYLARFPVSVWDENLPREIDIYVETLRKKLEGPKSEETKNCPKCGDEMSRKLIGDEWYWVCNECGQSQ